ncbi:hypothetical protein ACJ4Z0_04915 [Bifidobacterium catenulatum]|uniref:hypothetical protein n=1 Tax=Bifidobacterium catenulatum TaxID=1686 RepID=UPI003D34A765
MTSTVAPAYNEGTTEQRDMMRQEPERKPEPHPTRGETATPPALKQQKNKQDLRQRPEERQATETRRQAERKETS